MEVLNMLEEMSPLGLVRPPISKMRTGGSPIESNYLNPNILTILVSGMY